MEYKAFVPDVPHAFLVVPFHDSHAEAQAAMREAAQAIGLAAWRADDIKQSTAIIDRILRAVASADVVVADLTEHRANCFYELGYADAIRRPVVLVQKLGDETPFDVDGRSILHYRDPEQLRDELPKWLIEAAFVNRAEACDDDQNAGEFGRHALVDGYLLSARLTVEPPDENNQVWGWVQASIRRIDGTSIPAGTPAFLYMDPPTFPTLELRMTILNGVARAKFKCYGAFSLGAKIGDTALELDLRHVPGATDLFRLL